MNGTEVAKSAQNGLIQQGGVLRIGGNSVWGEYFQGYIDEVRIYNRALTATEVNNNLKTAVSSTTATSTSTGTSNTGLVAAYGFEETSGTTVNDASGNSNLGAISNAVRITNGHSGNALQFNGTNAWVTVQDSASLDLSTSMTLEAWVYPQSLANNGTVLFKEQSGGAVYNLYAYENAGAPVSSFNDGTYRVISGPNQLPVNQWTHLVSTYDGQYQRLYVNGTEVAKSAQNGLIQQGGVLRIGGNSVWGEYFQGYIDEVRIYNRALTATEVNNNLKTAVSSTTATSTSTGTSNTGLVAAYGFEETSGTTVNDASGNSNLGAISNAVRITNGHSGNALQFNGTNAWVTVQDSASLDLSTSMTLEAWVYPQSLANNGTVLFKEQSGGAVYNLYAYENAGAPVSSFNDGTYRVISGPNQLPVNQWTHLVSTYDGQYQRLYVNGTEVAKSAQNGLIQQGGVLRIGGNSVWGEYFHGYIDEVRIYNRALTATEVAYNLKTAISVSNPQ
ncbi:LamG domain protein jellyroll fold domain protein [Methylobacter tundripaludum SV96]|uniref:LamG domain protein jellyroll fold domain protein n=1 Tax=Methylobacter tundripaludum (strain ATCC BAA-1195 / DSM 17260 / SV96) TaxID=697282 RepID=G3IWT7_METTV|nr:LamG domain protein jellyroll fold domain protein [Methylobacter tundripaludum SV96]